MSRRHGCPGTRAARRAGPARHFAGTSLLLASGGPGDFPPGGRASPRGWPSRPGRRSMSSPSRGSGAPASACRIPPDAQQARDGRTSRTASPRRSQCWSAAAYRGERPGPGQRAMPPSGSLIEARAAPGRCDRDGRRPAAPLAGRRHDLVAGALSGAPPCRHAGLSRRGERRRPDLGTQTIIGPIIGQSSCAYRILSPRRREIGRIGTMMVVAPVAK